MSHSDLLNLHENVQWLRSLTAFKAMWRSPWLAELPLVRLRKEIENVGTNANMTSKVAFRIGNG
jgi:hypothetical protein